MKRKKRQDHTRWWNRGWKWQEHSLNVVFRSDEAFQRRKFYLGQKLKRFNFSSLRLFISCKGKLIDDILLKTKEDCTIFLVQDWSKVLILISQRSENRWVSQKRRCSDQNIVFSLTMKCLKDLHKSPHLIQKNMFECDSHV